MGDINGFEEGGDVAGDEGGGVHGGVCLRQGWFERLEDFFGEFGFGAGFPEWFSFGGEDEDFGVAGAEGGEGVADCALEVVAGDEGLGFSSEVGFGCFGFEGDDGGGWCFFSEGFEDVGCGVAGEGEGGFS